MFFAKNKLQNKYLYTKQTPPQTQVGFEYILNFVGNWND